MASHISVALVALACFNVAMADNWDGSILTDLPNKSPDDVAVGWQVCHEWTPKGLSDSSKEIKLGEKVKSLSPDWSPGKALEKKAADLEKDKFLGVMSGSKPDLERRFCKAWTVHGFIKLRVYDGTRKNPPAEGANPSGDYTLHFTGGGITSKNGGGLYWPNDNFLDCDPSGAEPVFTFVPKKWQSIAFDAQYPYRDGAGFTKYDYAVDHNCWHYTDLVCQRLGLQGVGGIDCTRVTLSGVAMNCLWNGGVDPKKKYPSPKLAKWVGQTKDPTAKDDGCRVM